MNAQRIENLRGVFAPPTDAGTQQTPEAERPFEYELKQLAQECLDNDMSKVGSASYVLEEIDRYTKAAKEYFKYQRNVPHDDISEQLIHEMGGFKPHVLVGYMIVTDHKFFKGKNEKDKWSDTDKRYLLDAALEAHIAFDEHALAEDARKQVYYSRRHLRTGVDSFKYLVQRDRQIQSQLRQRVNPTPSRIRFR